MDIKAGQVWVNKYRKDPVCVVEVDGDYICIDWIWQTQDSAWVESDGITKNHFLSEYEFYAESMPYHKFKQWCASWQKGGNDGI